MLVQCALLVGMSGKTVFSVAVRRDCGVMYLL